MKSSLVLLLLGALLSGCQASHSLKAPAVDYSQPLPAIHVLTLGAIPGHVLKNDLRRRGTFEQVINGRDPQGYNLLVAASSDYYGLHNAPLSLLSALTLFIVPAPVTWDSKVIFSLSRGEQALGTYYISNHTDAWRGIVQPYGGQPEHVQLIVDNFIAQVLKDPPFQRLEGELPSGKAP